MRIEEVRLAKEKMECDIFGAVTAAMSEFEAETGLSPDGIWLDLGSRQVIAGPSTNFLISVRADVSI